MSIFEKWLAPFRVVSMLSVPSKAFPSPYLPKDQKFSGLFLVIKSNAPAPVWEVKRNGQGRIIEIRHRKSWPYVRHFYFHFIDREWGHITIS